MSGALVPASSSFQQQGSVDWVELSGRSVNFSVAVLARLSKAGIDPFTLQVGRAICTNFSLYPVAQQRLSEAIQALRKFGSYGDVVWFGFGVKQVVTELAETEQGLSLVALCAALSSTYDSLYGARVLRELCGLCKAPQTFSPAVRQWKILVELCSGILNSGHFSLLLEGFRRLVLGGRNVPDFGKTERYPTSCSTLAEAIMTIAQLTAKRLASATFTGGLDCIWLAAVAESIFFLNVVIYNATDVQVYRSRSLDQQPPQIKICYIEESMDSQEQSFVSEKTSLILSGRTLFVRENGDSVGTYHLFNWRSSWSTILHDSFPESIKLLLTGETGHQFRLCVYCISMIHTELSDGDDPVIDIKISYLFNEKIFDSLRGHELLSFASKRLPELSLCLEHDFSLVPRDRFYSRALAALEALESKSPYACPQSKGIFNLRVLTEVIIIFLWITLASDIDEQIVPSITGLRWLYSRVIENSNGSTLRSRTRMEQIALVFGVLSGRPSLSSSLLAMAGAGVCVYRQVLLDPHLSPDSISRIRVMPGYISHAGALPKTISGISPRDDRPISSFDALSTCQSVDFIVQETEQDSEVAAAYLVNYINRQGEKKYLFLSLSVLLPRLQSIVRTFKCEGDCWNLTTKSPRDDDRPCNHERISWWRDIFRYSLVLFDQAACDNAQRLIADSQDLQNLWVSTSVVYTEGLIQELVDTRMLIDRPFMTYLSLMEAGRSHVCIFPLIQCFSCVIAHGWLGQIGYGDLRSRGFIRLVAPSRAEAEMHWGRTWTETPQEPSAVSRKENKRKSTSDTSDSSAGTPS